MSGAPRQAADLLEFLPVALLWLLASLLPVRAASALGARAGAIVGPRLGKHKKVLANLAVVQPHASRETLARLAKGVWQNAGAVLCEYPHLRRLAARRVEVVVHPRTREIVDAGKPFFVLSAHLANWELIATCLHERGIDGLYVYSRQPNPLLESAIQWFRSFACCEYVDKADALRRMRRAASAGKVIGALADTRVDSGTLLPLFGIDTPTTVSPARTAITVSYPIVPVQVIRLPGARFTLVLHEPLAVPEGGDSKRAAIEVTRAFNGLLEVWIAERPGQWLCTKRRFPQSKRAFR